MLQARISLDIHATLRYNLATQDNGPVAQLGARFNRTEEAGGSNPPRSTGQRPELTIEVLSGPIAQLGARLNGIEKAGGSNPPGSTNYKRPGRFPKPVRSDKKSGQE